MVIQKAKIETDKNNSAVKGAIDIQKKLENWKSSPLSQIFLKILWQFDYIDMKLKALWPGGGVFFLLSNMVLGV